MNSLSFSVPATATPTNLTFSRFRVAADGGLGFDGPAVGGAVEDYALEINGVDLGDAPDPGYPTLIASGGARHILSTGPHLGAIVDAEPDGQPTAAADEHDNDGIYDEDGVVFTSTLSPGLGATVDVITTASGLLNAWIDFNTNSVFESPSEQIFVDQALAAGLNAALPYAVPGTVITGTDTFALTRLARSKATRSISEVRKEPSLLSMTPFLITPGILVSRLPVG